MPKLSSAKSSSLTQAERLARKEKLSADAARLDEQLRAVQEEIAALLTDCDHTDAAGRSAILGGATKVCALCGKTMSAKGEKLWQ